MEPATPRPDPAALVAASDREYKARCEFAQHLFDRLVQWFTAFIAINAVAFGWILTQELDLTAILFVAAWMIVQLLLGAKATKDMMHELKATNDRVVRLLAQGEQSPIPVDLYRRSCRAVTLALYSTAFVWLATATYLVIRACLPEVE